MWEKRQYLHRTKNSSFKVSLQNPEEPVTTYAIIFAEVMKNANIN